MMTYDFKWLVNFSNIKMYPPYFLRFFPLSLASSAVGDLNITAALAAAEDLKELPSSFSSSVNEKHKNETKLSLNN